MKPLLFPALLCLSISVLFPCRISAQDSEDDIAITEADTNVALDSLVGGAAVWGMTPAQIEEAFKKKGFAWLDEKARNRGVIRPRRMWMKAEDAESKTKGVSMKMARHQLSLFSAPACEATLEFTADKLSSVSISIWNKGDATQPLSKAAYEESIKKSAAATNIALKSRGRDLGADNSGATKVSRWRWETPETIAQLESSFGRDAERNFAADFIRLRLAPKGQLNTARTAPSKLAMGSLTTRLKKTPEGDIYVDSVPMVDQGEKGYCAVASAERVMRYYGIEVDQHELAKAADTSQYGTKPGDFEDALHKLQGRFKVRVRDLISFDNRDYERMMANYNREAKKVGGRQWQAGSYYFEFNADIMREARCRNGAYEKFRDMVTNATSRGVPLLWALTLGRYPETGRENPQGGGGHMRTIIGYNAKTDEVLFTDSWGAGHELKRMKGRDACAATLGLYLVEPSS